MGEYEALESIIKGLFAFAIIVFVLAIVIYIAYGIFLNRFNKLLYGKGTPIAWIPIANLYLLGKLTFNKSVGWILVVLSFLTAETTTTVNGEVKTQHALIPGGGILSLVEFGLFIYAIIKYNKIKRGEISAEEAARKSNVLFRDDSSTAVSQPVNTINSNPNPVNNPTTPMTEPTNQTRFCTNCGTAIPQGSQFCPNCGNRI